MKPLLPRLFREPNDLTLVKEAESELLKKFKNESPYLLPSRPDTDWDWLSSDSILGFLRGCSIGAIR